MKTIYIHFAIFLTFLAVVVSPASVYPQANGLEDPVQPEFSLEFADPLSYAKWSGAVQPVLYAGLPGYGNNVWANRFFSVDTDDPSQVTIIGEMSSQTASGDFHPDENDVMYVIDINENYLEKIDIATAQTLDSVLIPVPLDGGIWSVLTIHKTTGMFYGVATNGTESNIYEIDPSTGATSLFFNTGLAAVISGTFDGDGTLWLFEIAGDDIYSLNMGSLNLELVGSTGFDGDSPQGMGYCMAEDLIFLAAYEKNVGPQLRLLNKETGEAFYLGDLPGETTAFGFPGGMGPVDHTLQIPAGWSGISSFVTPENPELAELLSEISGDFVLMQNNSGDIYWPAQNITTLQNWDAADGYIIKMSQNAVLTLTGMPVSERTMELQPGWNILAVPVPDAYPAEVLFGNTEGFVMAKEIAGTAVYWPEKQINTLGNMQPGKAYRIFSTQDISVSFQ
jgi:hypothetical protein